MSSVGMGDSDSNYMDNQGGNGGSISSPPSIPSSLETARQLAASSSLLRSAHRDAYETSSDSRGGSGLYTSGGMGGSNNMGGGDRGGGFGQDVKYGGGVAGGIGDAVLLGDVGNIGLINNHLNGGGTSTHGNGCHDETSTQGNGGNLDNFSQHSQTSNTDVSMRNNAPGLYFDNRPVSPTSHYSNSSTTSAQNQQLRRKSSDEKKMIANNNNLNNNSNNKSYDMLESSMITSPLLQQQHGEQGQLGTVIESARASDLSVEDMCNTSHHASFSQNSNSNTGTGSGILREGDEYEDGATTSLVKKRVDYV